MLRINTLGRLYVERDERRVAGAAAQPRRLALLAVLAAAGQKGVTRDRLLSMLWPDTEEERARKGLNQAIYALRQELGSDDAITGTRDLCLDTNVVRVDVTEFRSALARGDLEAAVHAYHGPFLDGFHLADAPEFERWVETERMGLARDHATSLERLARRATEAGDSAGAVEWWRRRASHDPLDAPTAARLMEALVRTGDRVGALKHARIYEVLIAQELELPPDREVVALAERIRREAEQAPAPAPTPVAAPGVAPSSAPAASPVASPVAARDGALAASTAHSNGDRAEPAAQVWRVTAPDLVAVPRSVPQADEGPAEWREEPLQPPPAPATPAAPPAPARPQIAPPLPPPAHAWADDVPPEITGATRHVDRSVSTRWSVGGAALVGAAVASALTVAAYRTARPSGDAMRLGATRRATFEAGLEVDPALSPDGKVLAYAAGPEGAMRLYVRQVAGGRPVMVTGELTGDHRRPRWSPDGARLLFQANRGIYTVPAFGGAARPVVEPPPNPVDRALYPSWSPDGATVAWVHRDTILVRPMDGGAPRAVAVIPSAHSPAWSPDGRLIAAVSGNHAFVYGAAEADLGNTSIGNRAPSAVWVVPADARAGDGRAVRATDAEHLNTSPEWLGGRRLLFVSDMDGTRDLYVLRVDGAGRAEGRPDRLTTGTGAHSVSATADGRTIAYAALSQRANAWALPIPTGGPVGTAAAQPITDGTQVVEGLDLSPDGRSLAYDTDLSGQQDLWRVPTDGSFRAEPVVEGPDSDFMPAWSPDGHTLAFYRFSDGVRRAYLVDASGGTPRALFPAGREDEHMPVWRPDGRALAFHRYADGRWHILTTELGADGAWRTPRPLAGHAGWGPRWSPDGRRIAYVDYGQVRVVGADGDARGMRVAFDARGTHDGAASLPSSLPAPVAARWAPDGSALYVKAFDADGRATLWAASPDGATAPRLLVRFDEPSRPTRRPEFATDGRRFYFTFAQSESDIWVVEAGR